MSDLFEQVTRKGNRFQLPQGELSVEQLWQLKPIRKNGELVDTLADYEAQLQEEVAKFGTFTRRTSAARTVAQEETILKLAVVSYILDVKDKEAQEAKDLASKKAFNEGILARLAKKQEAKLDDLSEEELLAMLK
jgi:hypothetical protein